MAKTYKQRDLKTNEIIEWSIDDNTYSLKIGEVNTVYNKVPGSIVIEDDIATWNNKKIYSSPRGWFIDNTWCPTIESVFSLLRENPKGEILIYDEKVK